MLKRIIPYIKPVWFRFVVALLGMASVAAITTGLAWILKFLFDHVLIERDVDSLHTGVILVLVGIGLKSILWYSHTYLTAYVGQTAAQKIREDAYEHLYSLSMGFFNEKTSGGILSRLTNDITLLQQSLTSAPTAIIRDGLTVLGLIGFLFYTNWRFSLICISILPVAAFVLTHLGKKSRRAGREGQSRMADMYNTIHEALAAMPIVKVFENEKKEIDHFKKQNRYYFDAIMKLVRVEARSSPIMEAIGAVILAFMLSVGGMDVIQGKWSAGSFVAYIYAALSLYGPIKNFAAVNVRIQQSLAAAERVFQLMDEKGTIVDQPGATLTGTIQKNLEFRNVSFSYPNGQMVLESLNLNIKKGEIIALVGPSGSGKTTIAQLLLRFYDPTEGAVLIDGHDFRHITLHSLRQQTAVVTQETHLFNDSVYNNIAYGKPNATREEVEAAAKAAYAHDFIINFQDGYNTIIGERGARVSGGEKQRIAIARALLKNPAILILDEATSALDTASEQMVQRALDHLLEGRTVLMIAHRLSTVRRADRIVVLEKGKVKEIGNHEELLNHKGAYHQLIQMQTSV